MNRSTGRTRQQFQLEGRDNSSKKIPTKWTNMISHPGCHARQKMGRSHRGGGVHCHGYTTIFSNPEGKLNKSILISGACTRRSNRCMRFPISYRRLQYNQRRQTTLNSKNNKIKKPWGRKKRVQPQADRPRSTYRQ